RVAKRRSTASATASWPPHRRPPPPRPAPRPAKTPVRAMIRARTRTRTENLRRPTGVTPRGSGPLFYLVLTAGVDLAPADERTALATIAWSRGRAVLRELAVGVPD